MPNIHVRKDESIDNALKRLRTEIQKSGLLKEIKRHEHYEKPSVRKKKKSEAARKRLRKRERRWKERKARY